MVALRIQDDDEVLPSSEMDDHEYLDEIPSLPSSAGSIDLSHCKGLSPWIISFTVSSMVSRMNIFV